MTVTGLIPCEQIGVCDAHNHVWIDGFEGADPANPVLDQFDHIREELAEYKKAGGNAILDCQPGGCGRDGRRLRELSESSGVNIIACTGFHRRKYYPQNTALWRLSSHSAADLFIKELTSSLEETADAAHPIKAGFLKVSLEGSWDDCPLPFLVAAAEAASKTGCMIEIHTEKGALSFEIVEFFSGRGVPVDRLVICHIDKRPDFGLHAELAAAGVLLEYDTFFRPKYEPETRLWPLIDRMVAAGLGGSVSLATDMAEKEMYQSIGGGPGLASLPRTIIPRLRERGIPEPDITRLTGGNIVRRLASLNLMESFLENKHD
jgi:phosphotriesterase-related protein